MAIIKSNPYTSLPNETISCPDCDGYKNIGEIYSEAKKLLISAHPFDIESFLKCKGFYILREDMEVDLSGYIEFRGNVWVVGVNKYHNHRRQRFTMAHEFSHYLFDRKLIVSNKHFDSILFRSTETDKGEVRANTFAAQLLIPRNLLEGYIHEGITNIEELADKFDVSPAALRYRAFRLGYIQNY